MNLLAGYALDLRLNGEVIATESGILDVKKKAKTLPLMPLIGLICTDKPKDLTTDEPSVRATTKGF